MYYREIKMDLFSLPNDYALAHCVSADFAMGAGIAVQFVKRFDQKKFLKSQKCKWEGKGFCVFDQQNKVFNLVTKKLCIFKPVLDNVIFALEDMKRQAIEKNITKIGMPKIGCGIDGLNWSEVSKCVQSIFENTNIEIVVCYIE